MLIDSFSKISSKDIDEFELKCDLKLPEEYRRFLFENNGGEPQHHEYEIEGKYDGDISHFFGIRSYPAPGDLRTEWEEYRDRIPQDYLPIGASYGGDLICISLKPNEIGTVYRWDHETARVDDEAAQDDLVKLANNLNEFLSMLYTES